MFSSCPVFAFVEGVKIGCGSCCDSTSPSGSRWPHTSPVARSPSSPSRRGSRARRTRSAASRAAGTPSSGRPRAARAGGSGRGRASARTRSRTGRSARVPCRGSRSAGRRRRSRCGRWRRAAAARRRARRARGPSRFATCVAVSDMDRFLLGGEAAKSVEGAVEVGDRRFEVEDVASAAASRCAVISGSARTSSPKSRSSSHARIAFRCTSRYASARSSPPRRARAAAGARRRGRATPRGSAPSAPDRRRALDDPREAIEHVVEREECVRHDDALGRRVRDVALVPERHVLEPDDRGRADDAREPGDPLGDLRVALVRHRRRALHAGGERLLDLAHLGAREMTDLGREPVERRRADGERRRAARRAGRARSPGSTPDPARGRAARRRCARPPGRSRRTSRPCPRAGRRGTRRGRARAVRATRSSSNAQPASFQPKVIGSAWIPCERPMQTVRRCSSARRTTAASARSMPASSSSPASRICSASAVSTTSDDVRP